ncbi:MAG: virion morphogenesis protein [Desulfobacter sp.]|nr:virion morphogenesis protein [Desulfobacter sp.]WDP86152.1 MAG: virion morphogenesis protein [Desulfobacter sp.]
MALPDISIDTDKRSRLRLADQIDVLTMPPARRKRLLKEISKQTRKDMRTNIRKQQTVTGAAMEPRAGKKRKRMMGKMAKGMVTRIIGTDRAMVTWKNPAKAKLADRHHHGVPEKYTAKKAARQNGVPDYSKPATPKQAKALNKEGFRRPVARKRGKGKATLKRVSQKWIRDNMSLGQAGLILRLMRTGTRKGKQGWEIKVPARPILGATPEQANTYLTAMATNALREINKI